MRNIVVFMATATKREDQKIVQRLLKQYLIACLSILEPVESRFWWKKKSTNPTNFEF
jgi:uncharacterized protein involved in tolerance to divalent cations